MSSAARSSFDGAGVAVTANQMGAGGLQDELGPEEFDGLLHPNMLETLADFDFSYADLGEATGSEAPLQQQQQQPQQKLSGRKRSLPQSCSWDNLSPKAISEMSASLLAGSGWDVGSITNININHTNSNNSPQQPAQITTPACGARDAPAAAASARLCSGNNSHGHPPVAVGATASAAVKPQQQQQAGKNNNNGKAHAGAGYSKGRRGAGAGAAAAGGGAGSAKRLLNPDRMERKASREKRRREEVNQQFDQLLKVLEDAEATSGLEPPPAKEGKTAAHACINGRRVEVLSRTIKVLKKLLQEKRDSLAGEAAAAAAAGSPCAQEVSSWDGSQRAVEEETPPPVVTGAAAAAPAPAPAVSDVFGSTAESVHFGGNAAVEAKEECNPHALEAPKLAAAMPGAGSEINPSSVVQRMAVPLSGHHASMMMPPGFAGMSGHAMSAPNAPGHHGQPIFFAVPMFMPQGQGMPAQAQGVDNASLSTPTVATPLPAPVPTAAAATATAATAPGVVEKVEPSTTAPSGKEAWAMPAGMGYQTMVLPTPQFVTQALSTEEADEKPTHAVCA